MSGELVPYQPRPKVSLRKAKPRNICQGLEKVYKPDTEWTAKSRLDLIIHADSNLKELQDYAKRLAEGDAYLENLVNDMVLRVHERTKHLFDDKRWTI